MIIEKALGNVADLDLGSRSVDPVFVTHEDLLRLHQKLQSSSGETLRISLDEGETLKNGDVIAMDENRAYVIELVEEKVFRIVPHGTTEVARVAFNVGNMHQKLYIYDDKLLVPYDELMTRMMDALKVEYTVTEEKLDGLLANLPASYGHHHHHDHDHGHDHHHHDHEHGHDHSHSHHHHDHSHEDQEVQDE